MPSFIFCDHLYIGICICIVASCNPFCEFKVEYMKYLDLAALWERNKGYNLWIKLLKV